MTNQENTTKQEKSSAIQRRFMGVVVSDKMDKTLTVKVAQVKIQPKYNKRFTVSKKFKVHDEKNQYHAGDQVTFVECRPLSKDKRWRVLYS